MSNENEHADIVEGATVRARAYAHLKAHPGERFNRMTLAEAIQANEWTTAEVLNTLADSGQIERVQEGSRKWYFYGQPPEGPQLPLPAVAKAAPKKKKKSRPSENPTIGIGERIRDIMCADPTLSEEEVGRRVRAEGFEFRPPTLRMVYRDTHDVIERMAARAPRKALTMLVPERRRAPGEVEITIAGGVLVVGRNPETGRLRLGVEDDS